MLAVQMARRPEPKRGEGVLTPEQIADLRRNLSLLSPYHVMKFYTDSYMEAAPEKRPCPRVMQQLITAWKLLRRWEWPK